jgi:hypothetical protein
MVISLPSAFAQSVSFQLKSSPNLSFSFNTFAKYQQGITMYNVMQLNVEATGTQWDLYVGTSTQIPGNWDVAQSYHSNYGNPNPPVNILKLRVSNMNNTSRLGNNFVSLTDIATPLYIIGSSTTPDATTPCSSPGAPTNVAGSYLTNPKCYKFNVDYKLVPGTTYSPGLYNLRVDFWIVADL